MLGPSCCSGGLEAPDVWPQALHGRVTEPLPAPPGRGIPATSVPPHLGGPFLEAQSMFACKESLALTEAAARVSDLRLICGGQTIGSQAEGAGRRPPPIG